MIQRIQSVFLLLAGASSFAPFGLPFASSAEGAVLSSNLFADGLYNIHDHLIFPIIFALAGALAIISIFLFAKRRLQMRMVMLTAIIVFFAIAYVVIFYLDGATSGVEVNVRLGALFPILAFLFALLAHRFIKKDEKLVKSMDRLR